MKKLNRKVFLTIFIIISFFATVGVISNNISTYKKEYDSVYMNLNFIDSFSRPNIPRRNTSITRPNVNDLDELMIANYEVYTVKLKDNAIYKITAHGNEDSNFDVESAAKSIIENGQGIKVGNLYNNKYAYNYKSKNTIVIINTESINKKLTLSLVKSIIFLLVMEVLIYFVSIIITNWITKPARESFDKQKEFIADASHELKTPLAVIMASSDELKSDKKNAKYVENIKYESDRMNKLITGLLDLSKLENGINIDNYKEENISKIVEKNVLVFESIAFENDIQIETNIEKDIEFKCSKEEIEKLISILLDNAIKHSYKDSNIFVNVNKDKTNIYIDVTNSGDPIKEGDEENIFERFYRADKSRKREANRYGLGLAIAKNIVTNHNGTINAFSKDGKTTFKIVFKK